MNELEQTPRALGESSAVLLDVERILAGALPPDELYRAIQRQAARVLDVAGFYIALYDADTDTVRVVFYAHDGQEMPADIAFRGSHSAAVRTGRAVFQGPADADFATLRLGLSGAGQARSAMAAPIFSDGKVIGLLGVQSPEPDAYDPDDLELLQAIAAVTGVTLGSAEHVRNAERRRREAERLEEIGNALTASLDLPEVLQRVLSAALELMAADGAAVLLVDGEHRAEMRIAAVGGDTTFHEGDTVALPPGLWHRLVQERCPLVIQHVGPHPLLPPAARDANQDGSAVAAPLVAGDHAIGVLSAGHRSNRAYHADDLALLERLAVHAAIAVENARLHEQIRSLSLTDPLTGLPNRRHLETVLDREFAAARRGRRLAVVLFDLDRFKQYNDTAGHQAGDDALRAFAHVLTAETRAFDLAARYGGDEFLCILSEVNTDGATAHVARIRHAVEQHPLLHAVGVSAGHAYYHPSMTGVDDLIRAADLDLYRHKRKRGST
jgi:diguanylate cyclase (GGDEF)-like protein